MSAKAEVATPKRQGRMSAINLESGQSEAAPPAGFTTPINKTAGTDLAHASEVGSVFVDGKRRSARANYSYTANGIYTWEWIDIQNPIEEIQLSPTKIKHPSSPILTINL